MDNYSIEEMVVTEAETEVAAAPEKPVRKKSRKKCSILKATSVGGLILRIVLFLVIPYAYLMLCGLIFDRTLHMYNMTTFIFFSYAALQIAGIVLSILAIIRYVKYDKAQAAKQKKSKAVES